MKTEQSKTVIHCTTDDGWRYSGYRTSKKAPHHWAGERKSPEGKVEPLRLFEFADDIRKLAMAHEPSQRDLF